MRLALSQEELAGSDAWYFQRERWPIYRQVIAKAQECGIPFSIGGGFAQMAYSGWPREAKDVDIFVLPQDRDAMIQLTRDLELHDYYDEKPYDRAWIYRSKKQSAILDVIWAMANQRTQVDRRWIECGPELAVDGVRFRLMPPEDLLWIKLYIIQQDRSDWPDALNLIHTCGLDLDWRYLIARLGDDLPLLTALLALFSWLCPEAPRRVPNWLMSEAGLKSAKAGGGPDAYRRRADLLDTRPWFVPTLAKEGE